MDWVGASLLLDRGHGDEWVPESINIDHESVIADAIYRLRKVCIMWVMIVSIYLSNQDVS